jgi:hypothetical protein
MDSIFGSKFVEKKSCRNGTGHQRKYRLGESYELSKQRFGIKDPDWANKIDIYHHISQSSVPVADTVAVPSPVKRKAPDTDVINQDDEVEWVKKFMPAPALVGDTSDVAPAHYQHMNVEKGEFDSVLEQARTNANRFHVEVDRFDKPVSIIDTERATCYEYTLDYSWMDREQVVGKGEAYFTDRPEPKKEKKMEQKRVERKPKVLDARGTPSVATVFADAE